MMRRRCFLLSLAASVAIAACLSDPAELMAAENAYIVITGEGEDPRFNQPYIDVEEWRDVPADTPNVLGDTTQSLGLAPIKARHLYVHGGFKGTDARFSFHFPPKEQYQGRFYQATHQLLTSENAPAYNVAMSVAAGAYCVQTNMGGSEIARSAEVASSGTVDPSVGQYRVNAAAAKFSRVVAQRVYERKHRPFGYLYGGSGGSIQVIDSAQNTSGVWDGFLPYVMGNGATNPAKFLARAHAFRVLKDKWPSIMDAFEPGGSGDPYAGLDPEEKLALEEVTLYGFPPRAWFNYVRAGTGPMGFVAAFVPLRDPTYIPDFWTKPGYIAPTSSAKSARIQSEAKVLRVTEGSARSQFMVGTQLELSSVPVGDLFSADVIGVTGESKGKSAPLGTVNGNTISFRLGANPEVVRGFRVGDTVSIDNSGYLALQTYYRYALPPRGSVNDFPVFDAFRNADGSPKYPQRALIAGAPDVNRVPPGKIHGKMIGVQCLLDGDALPWEASWYQKRVRDTLGAAFDDNFRLMYIDNAEHTSPKTAVQRTHVVSYQGALEQTLRDLSAWVEKGVTPPSSTNHTVEKGQVHVPATAAARKGIQPVVDLKVDGGVRAEVAVGKPVTFTATIEMPPGTGPVVAADWDFDGTGEYATPERFKDSKSAKVTLKATHTYDRPGTYLAAIRATSQRDGDTKTPYARVQNLGRVRVVVK